MKKANEELKLTQWKLQQDLSNETQKHHQELMKKEQTLQGEIA